jgi:hypothetical protein
VPFATQYTCMIKKSDYIRPTHQVTKVCGPHVVNLLNKTLTSSGI